MKPIPDFTETELWTVRTTVKERYGKEVEVQHADAELRLDPGSTTLTPCPTLYWSERGAHLSLARWAKTSFAPSSFTGSTSSSEPDGKFIPISENA